MGNPPEDPSCSLDRVEYGVLGVAFGKPLPIEPRARDANQGQREAQHGADRPHAAFEGGDPFPQCGLGNAILV